MKRIGIILGLLSLFAPSVWAQSPGDMLTVTVPQGQNMRDQPSASGKIVVLVPKGASVKVLDPAGPTDTLLGKTGPWMKVNWFGQPGWMFAPIMAGAGNPAGDSAASELRRLVSFKEFQLTKSDPAFVLSFTDEEFTYQMAGPGLNKKMSGAYAPRGGGLELRVRSAEDFYNRNEPSPGPATCTLADTPKSFLFVRELRCFGSSWATTEWKVPPGSKRSIDGVDVITLGETRGLMQSSTTFRSRPSRASSPANYLQGYETVNRALEEIQTVPAGHKVIGAAKTVTKYEGVFWYYLLLPGNFGGWVSGDTVDRAWP